MSLVFREIHFTGCKINIGLLRVRTCFWNLDAKTFWPPSSLSEKYQKSHNTHISGWSQYIKAFFVLIKQLVHRTLLFYTHFTSIQSSIPVYVRLPLIKMSHDVNKLYTDEQIDIFVIGAPYDPYHIVKIELMDPGAKIGLTWNKNMM